MIEIQRTTALDIIEHLGAYGTPPEYGVRYFTEGIQHLLDFYKKEYFAEFIKNGGSIFRLVTGGYGSGKTHFLYCIRDVAWEENYLVSYVSLSPRECPFTDLSKVYQSIVNNLMYPMTEKELKDPTEHGINGVLKVFVREKFLQGDGNEKIDNLLKSLRMDLQSVESSSFAHAVYHAIRSLVEEDFDIYEGCLQWLKGEEPPSEIKLRYGITEKLDKTTAQRRIRSLAQTVRKMGYSGLVLIFDEAEMMTSIATQRSKKQVLNNLRELIDECARRGRLPSTVMFYAIPDKRELLDGEGPHYEALRQRVSSYFNNMTNPSGVIIDLENQNLLRIREDELLKKIGDKISQIYFVAYPEALIPPNQLKEMIQGIVDEVIKVAPGVVSPRRLFVKSLIAVLHLSRARAGAPVLEDEIRDIVKENLQVEVERQENYSEEEEF